MSTVLRISPKVVSSTGVELNVVQNRELLRLIRRSLRQYTGWADDERTRTMVRVTLQRVADVYCACVLRHALRRRRVRKWLGSRKAWRAA